MFKDGVFFGIAEEVMHPFVYFELTKQEAFGPYNSLCVRYPDNSKSTFLPRSFKFRNSTIKPTEPKAILNTVFNVLKKPTELVILVRNLIDASVGQQIFFPTESSLSEFKIPVYFHVMSTNEKMKSMSELRSEVMERGLSIFKGLPMTDVVSNNVLLSIIFLIIFMLQQKTWKT